MHYVSPSVWAWRRERVGKIVHQVNRVLCLFPMEPQLYLDAGGRAEFVGHPMAQLMPLEDDRETARQTLGVDAGIPVFALLPGSRVSEIDYMAPV
ncbi:lipid-A-disaccharide synthase, partial [Klebsiella pneumoniae]|nr:lipid-A-disaccharide synthase [Klebsiella pneumoniae]